ncbi:hypothetical protein EVB56_086 [Rhizobium phage RHph_Y1_10]|nr:hypothetical protein EVB56_086 [Rhizobium phage RHph_Y1_10]
MPLTLSVVAAVFVAAALKPIISPVAYAENGLLAVTVTAFAVPPAVTVPPMSFRSCATRVIIALAESLTDEGN